MLLAGLLLFVGGFTGFGIYGQRQKTLLQHGLHATGTVVGAAPYLGGSPFDPGTYNEHADVAFIDQAQKPVIAHLGIGESDPHRIGEQVQIVYNPKNPTQAVFSSGYTDIGSAGFWFFTSLALGFCLAIFAGLRLSMIRRARRALRGSSKSMTVTSALLPRGRFQRWAISLADGGNQPIRFWSWSKTGCAALQRPTTVSVFGELKPRSVVVVVQPDQLVAVAGWIPRRWREPRRRGAR